MPSNEQWMAWCESGAAIFSTCSRRSYMAIVLAESGRVLGTGYNGTPSGLTNCRDGGCPRAATSVQHGSSYGNCTAVHAEANALLHSDRSAREGGTLIVNGPPCWECSKLIAGSGISTVLHKEDDAYADWPKCLQLLESVGIRVIRVATTNEHGDRSGSLGFWTGCPVDVARGSANGTPLASGHRNVGPLGNDPLDNSDDSAYTVELAQATQGDS